MKYTFRVPTQDPYAYVEVEYEDKDIPSVDIAETYTTLKNQFKVGTGLDEKLFNKFIDNQLKGIGNDIEEYNQMSSEQQNIVQTIKRAIKRVAYASQDN